MSDRIQLNMHRQIIGNVSRCRTSFRGVELTNVSIIQIATAFQPVEKGHNRNFT